MGRKGINRGAIAADRVAEESGLADFSAFDQLFQIVVASEAPPHQILVMVLLKLLQWTPALIVAASSRTLWDIEGYVEKELEEVWAHYGLGAQYVHSRLKPLRDRLASVGLKRLEDCYTSLHPDDRSAEVSHWCESIIRHACRSCPTLGAIRLTAANAMPHWALAFAYMHGLCWQAQRVVKHCSPCSLTELTQQVEDELLKDKRTVKCVAP